MAATATPYGMRPIGTLGGRAYTGSTRMYPIATTEGAIWKGDGVVLEATGAVARATHDADMTSLVVGIFMGCFFTDSVMGPQFRNAWPAAQVATDAVAYVVDDPYVVFRVQGDGTIPAAAVGTNTGMLEAVAESTINGVSRVQIDASAVLTTATLPVRLIGLVEDGTNTAGDAFTDAICIFNPTTHQYNNIGTGI